MVLAGARQDNWPAPGDCGHEDQSSNPQNWVMVFQEDAELPLRSSGFALILLVEIVPNRFITV